MIAPLFPLPDGDPAAGESLEDELAHIWALCDPGRRALAHGPFTFCPSETSGRNATLPGTWASWVRDEFSPRLAPALMEARAHATSGRLRELRTLDLQLSDPLNAGERERLSLAGRAVLEGMLPMRALGWPQRFLSWVETGICPGLLPTVFAARCAAFHLPLRATLLGYALCEWRAAGCRGADEEQAMERAITETQTLWRASVTKPDSAFPGAAAA